MHQRRSGAAAEAVAGVAGDDAADLEDGEFGHENRGGHGGEFDEVVDGDGLAVESGEDALLGAGEGLGFGVWRWGWCGGVSVKERWGVVAACS